MTELLHRSVRDAIGSKCNKHYFDEAMGDIIRPYLHRKVAIFVTYYNKFNFDIDTGLGFSRQ